jgi:ABC-type glycerol-3-phosphate transport system substrate-binding protein
VATLLPGGAAGLDVQGVAISSGTRYPDQAYLLAKHITSNRELAYNPFSAMPARRSMAGQQPAEGDGPRFFRRISPENQQVVDEAVTKALPLAEMRFGQYVESVLETMRLNGVDARTALQEADAKAVVNLQTAADRRPQTVVQVATPIPEPVSQPGETPLNFGILSFINPMPSQERWEQLTREFAERDAQVSKITLDSRFGSAAEYAKQYDCFYLPYNAVPGLDLATVLNLDPYMDADSTFNRGEVVGNSLAQLQRDNKTWAFPIIIQPQSLNYHSRQFEQASVPAPADGWTIDAFNDALKMLKTYRSDQSPFVPRDPGGSYLLMLIAAYGGLPLDYRTNPPTINFTDPATVNAVRQVLDLAKSGHIKYQELARTQFFITADNEENAIYTEFLTRLRNRRAFVQTDTVENGDSPYRMTTYPSGPQYTALGYEIGTAYISANAKNPDACYRWISTISRQPDLFDGMPARRSLMTDPGIATAQGADSVAIFSVIDKLMQAANAVVFPSPFGGNDNSPRNFLTQFWLNRAFDNYVLKNADLEAELKQAEGYVKAFQGCVANIPPIDPAQRQRDYFRQFTDCAKTVDPSMANLFPE